MMVILFLLVAMGFALVSLSFCIYNARKVPYQSIKGHKGIYIWNCIAGMWLHFCLYYTVSSCVYLFTFLSLSDLEPSPCLFSFFRGPGSAVFPGSYEAPQANWAGGQFSGDPLCADCPGGQTGLVFLAWCWQHCNSLCRLWSGGNEPDQTAQTRDQEARRTNHLFPGPTLLNSDLHQQTFTPFISESGWKQWLKSERNTVPEPVSVIHSCMLIGFPFSNLLLIFFPL